MKVELSKVEKVEIEVKAGFYKMDPRFYTLLVSWDGESEDCIKVEKEKYFEQFKYTISRVSAKTIFSIHGIEQEITEREFLGLVKEAGDVVSGYLKID